MADISVQQHYQGLYESLQRSKDAALATIRGIDGINADVRTDTDNSNLKNAQLNQLRAERDLLKLQSEIASGLNSQIDALDRTAIRVLSETSANDPRYLAFKDTADRVRQGQLNALDDLTTVARNWTMPAPTEYVIDGYRNTNMGGPQCHWGQRRILFN